MLTSYDNDTDWYCSFSTHFNSFSLSLFPPTCGYTWAQFYIEPPCSSYRSTNKCTYRFVLLFKQLGRTSLNEISWKICRNTACLLITEQPIYLSFLSVAFRMRLPIPCGAYIWNCSLFLRNGICVMWYNWDTPLTLKHCAMVAFSHILWICGLDVPFWFRRLVYIQLVIIWQLPFYHFS